MTGPDGQFAYSQARLQARLGSRPATSDWQRVGASRDLPALLRICGASSFAAWTRGPRRPHGRARNRAPAALALAHAGRRDGGVAACRLARAFAWLRWLPYLPALEKLARAGKPPGWMRGDPVLGAIVAEDPRRRASSVAGTAFAPLAAGFGTPPDVTQAWCSHWRSLWPVRPRAALERVVREVVALPGLWAASPPGASSAPTLARLERRLLAAFRRHPLTELATVGYLGLAGSTCCGCAAGSPARAAIPDRGRGMSLRPRVAHWFELLTSREELGATLDCLAQTGSVQLQACSRSESRLALPDLRQVLNEYETLARRHAAWWPQPHCPSAGSAAAADRGAAEGDRAAASVGSRRDPAVAELERSRSRAAKRKCCSNCSRPGADPCRNSIAWRRRGPCSAAGSMSCRAAGRRCRCRRPVISQSLAAEQGDVPGRRRARVGHGATSTRHSRHARVHVHRACPADLPAGRAATAGRRSSSGSAHSTSGNVRRTRRWPYSSERHAVADALGEISLAAWVVAHVPSCPVTEHFAWVTGWCADRDARRLQRALDARGLHYLLRIHRSAGRDEVPPSVLRNPALGAAVRSIHAADGGTRPRRGRPELWSSHCWRR